MLEGLGANLETFKFSNLQTSNLFSFFSCTAKPARAAPGIAQRFRFEPRYLFVAGDDHLCDAFAGFDGLWFVGEVNDDALDFAAIIAVDGAGRIEHRESAFGGEAAAWTDLGFVAIRQFDEQPGGDKRPFEGLEYDRFTGVGANVHTCTPRCFIPWQGVGGLIDDFDFQRLSDFGCKNNAWR